MARTLTIVVPDLLDQHGGIARISRSLVAAAATWAAERGIGTRVHALNDRGGGAAPASVDYVAYIAHGGSRVSLARAVVADALRSARPLMVFGHVNLAPLGLATALRGGTFAIVVHGLEVWLPLSLARRAALRAAAAVWPVSRYTGQDLVGRRLVTRPPVVIHNCLDASRNARAVTPPPETPVSFLTIARLSFADRAKGVDQTIAAFAHARPRLPARATLEVVGDGDDRARLVTLALSLGVADAVRFHGAVDDATVDRLLTNARALVLPSTIEGFGLVYVEAMARGRAVIATRATAVPEVVLHDETGLLAPPADVAALAESMVILASDHARAKAMGAAGRVRVLAHFSYERYAREVADALTALADG